MPKKVYLVVSIDTECDKDLNWNIPKPITFKNIFIQKDRLFPVFEKYSIKPTYLLSPEVLQNNESINFFKKLKNIELGTHLHEEFIEPNSKLNTTRTKNIQADLNFFIEKSKLINITNLFKKQFGYSPISFRSGRFGSSENTLNFLEELGYKVDSSVTPFKTLYFDSGVKINHWGKKIEPYFKNKRNKKHQILQVPLTLINKDFSKLPNFVLKRIESKSTFFKKILRKLGFVSRTRWLRPYRENGRGLIEISEYVISNNFKKNDVVLNIMFHSNEILENASPYCKDKDEVNEFIGSLEQLFSHLSKKYKLCSIGLGEVYDLYSQK